MLVLYAETASATLIVIIASAVFIIFLSHRRLSKVSRVTTEGDGVPEPITTTQPTSKQSSKKTKERKKRAKGKEKVVGATLSQIQSTSKQSSGGLVQKPINADIQDKEKPSDDEDVHTVNVEWYMKRSEQPRVSSPSSSDRTMSTATTTTTFQSSIVPLTPPQSTILPPTQSDTDDSTGHACDDVIPFSDNHPPLKPQKLPVDISQSTSSKVSRLPTQPPSPQEPPRPRNSRPRKDASPAPLTPVQKPPQNPINDGQQFSRFPHLASSSSSSPHSSDSMSLSCLGSSSTLLAISDPSSRQKSGVAAAASASEGSQTSSSRSESFTKDRSPSKKQKNQRDRDLVQLQLPPRHRKQGLDPSSPTHQHPQYPFSGHPPSILRMTHIPPSFPHPLPLGVVFSSPHHGSNLSSPLSPSHTFPLAMAPSHLQTPFPFPAHIHIPSPGSLLSLSQQGSGPVHDTDLPIREATTPAEERLTDDTDVIFPSLNPLPAKSSGRHIDPSKVSQTLDDTGESEPNIQAFAEVECIHPQPPQRDYVLKCHTPDSSGDHVMQQPSDWATPQLQYRDNTTDLQVMISHSFASSAGVSSNNYSTTLLSPVSNGFSPYLPPSTSISAPSSHIAGTTVPYENSAPLREELGSLQYHFSRRLHPPSADTDGYNIQCHLPSPAPPPMIHSGGHTRSLIYNPSYPTLSSPHANHSPPYYFSPPATPSASSYYRDTKGYTTAVEPMSSSPYLHPTRGYSHSNDPDYAGPAGQHSRSRGGSDGSGSVSGRLLGAIFKNPDSFAVDPRNDAGTESR